MTPEEEKHLDEYSKSVGKMAESAQCPSRDYGTRQGTREGAQTNHGCLSREDKVRQGGGDGWETRGP